MAKVSYPHYAWAVGHGLVLLGTLHTFLGFVTLSFRSKSYYLAYAGAILSWGIVVYKSLGVPQPNRAYVQRALLDENVQYLLLALYWFLTKPIAVTLLPFATFSLFHTLTFLRTSVLPKVPTAPSKSSSSSSSSSSSAAAAQQQPTSAGARLSKGIQTWVKANYETAMLFVAYIEVGLVFGRILLGAITFQNSLLTPLIFGHFLRLRYYLSPPTRTAFGWLNGRVEHHIVKNNSVPAVAKKGVVMIRELIIRYSESIIQVQQPGAAAGGGAGNAAQQRRAQ
ncbi:uncharacterized protein JCM6883_003058 [Sporobolomyces salmoneus]|uniref:uncharacterized protein n=1 Tax=Sporobolomyces salmoneus TaxID=183962 RepID=UPI00317139FE